MNADALVALLVASLSGTLPPAQTGRTRLIVIVPASQTVSDFSIADLRRIYLGEITRWPNGHRIVPVMLAPRSPEADLFLRRVVRMSAIDFAQSWIGAVFRGRVPAPPLLLSRSADAMRFVTTHQDAMAVVGDDVNIDVTVRIATVDQKSPEAADYPLMW